MSLVRGSRNEAAEARSVGAERRRRNLPVAASAATSRSRNEAAEGCSVGAERRRRNLPVAASAATGRDPERGFADHFSGIAPSYAEARPHYPDELFDWLAANAPGRERAWDCATGNGQAAFALAARFARVVATDASLRQLAAAPPDRPSNVCLAQALADAAPLADGCCDLVTVAQAVHWFAEGGFYGEARRVLRSGGLLAVWCYGLTTVSPAVDAVLLRLYRDTLGPWWPPERAYIDGRYRDLPFPFPEIAVPELAIEVTWSLPQFLAYLRTWSAARRHLEATGVDAVERAAADLAEAFGPEPRTVAWPLTVRAGRRP